MTLQPHELANLFPWIDDSRFGELVASIKQNGLLEPIWTLDNKILDGRNRYKACIEAGVTPITRPYEGDDPLGFVVAMNLNRRHLDDSQRAMVAGKIANLKNGNPAFSNSVNLPNWENTEGNGTFSEPTAVSQSAAADMMNVSTKSVTDAKVVNNKGSESLIKAVESGKVAVSNAAKLARKYDHKTQDAVIALVALGTKFSDALNHATAKPKGTISGGTVFDPAELDAAPSAPKDKIGVTVPKSLLPIFADYKDELQEVITESKRLEAKALDIAKRKTSRRLSEAFTPVHRNGIDTFEQGDLAMFRHKVRKAMPHAVCIFCFGTKPSKCVITDPVTGRELTPCDCSGWMDKETYEKASKIKKA